MTTYDLTLDTLNCGNNGRYIQVDFNTVEVEEGDTLRFINDLTPKRDAFLWVHPVGNKGGPPISGFCDGWGSSLTIENDSTGSGEGICEVTGTGIFQYTVTADMHVDLDPVIIIEPKISNMMPGDAYDSFPAALTSPVGGILTLAVLGGVAAVSYRVGIKAAMKNNQAS